MPARRTKRGEDYYTGLPIALDATQSGIQIYAAMGRNLDDGQTVNLTENERPGDLYTAVMNKAREIVDENISGVGSRWSGCRCGRG